ncbi:MAG: hypothetical protein RBT02_02420 [Bacteroidales bacterium]|nr:hypothetical protein [Bacteroidales bacterium]
MEKPRHIFTIRAFTSGDESRHHLEKSTRTVAGESLREIPITTEKKALVFRAVTGLLSFLLRDKLKEITLVDNSAGMVSNQIRSKKKTPGLNLGVFDKNVFIVFRDRRPVFD